MLTPDSLSDLTNSPSEVDVDCNSFSGISGVNTDSDSFSDCSDFFSKAVFLCMIPKVCPP